MLKHYIFLVLVILMMPVTQAEFQTITGVNDDIEGSAEGRRPYELDLRKEQRKPVVTFEDCTQWTLRNQGVQAGLYRTQEQKLWRDYCGKLAFTATDENSEMWLELNEPVIIKEPWDCLAMWVYGHRWPWTDQDIEPLELEFVLEDAKGQKQQIPFHGYYKGAINHKDWFFLRVKVHKKIKRPCKFSGIKISGSKITLAGQEKAIYLGPIYAYKEVLKPLSFEKWPESLPFPLKGGTILPQNKCKEFSNSTTQEKDEYIFRYQGQDGELQYSVVPKPATLGDILLTYNGSSIEPCAESSLVLDMEDEVKWRELERKFSNDKLSITWQVSEPDINKLITLEYTIRQKSLVIEMKESDNSAGIVKAIHLGGAKGSGIGELIQVPYLNFNYAEAPRVACIDNIFVFSQFDWYYSQASQLEAKDVGKTQDKLIYNGGAIYTPKTDGKRNCLQERLYLNASDDFQEVLPNIPNPPSPMKDMMGHRAWLVMNCEDYHCRWSIPKKFRALGIECVAVRYHEGAWRDVGESYTFKTITAPKQGGDAAMRKLVSDIKSLGWLCGLYSNYTDMVTLNPHWDEDWMLHDKNGNWLPSWFRCYSPKPMIGVEQQKNFSPIIHDKFSTNHCYSDVHTAVPIFDRVDYDYRVPGAGTFRRTYECYGRILLGERDAHKGPVFSEGGNHWWYAGLADGNYANAFPLLNEQLLLVDFDLLKLHTLQMDALTNNMSLDEQLAYGLAYAHIGQLISHDAAGSMKIYYMLQPLQSYFTLVPVKKILYHNGKDYIETSEALISGGIEKRRVHVVFENGFQYWVNLSSENWLVSTKKGEFELPPTGFVAFSKDGAVMAVSVLVEPEGKSGKVRVDYSYCPESHYFDSRGSNLKYGVFEGTGSVALKKEIIGWELIPAADFSKVTFSLDIIGFKDEKTTVMCLDKEGRELMPASFKMLDGKICVTRDRKNIFKYRLKRVFSKNK